MMQSALFGGTVESRRTASHALFSQLAEKLREDVAFMDKLNLLTDNARAVGSHMETMGLGPLCIRCSSRPGGGCCSLFMAGETDALQMFMNLLAGVDVRPVQDNGRECCFLGVTGCIFLFKPMFCLNYNCINIHQAATPSQIGELERLTGILLTKQYALEQLLLARIRQEGLPIPKSPPLDLGNPRF